MKDKIMKELKIDEEHLDEIANEIYSLISYLKEDVNSIKNKDADIFERYMAYCKLLGVISHINMGCNLHKTSMYLGHCIAYETFQTEEAKRCGWALDNLEKNPFFKDENKKPPMNPFEDLIGNLKKMKDIIQGPENLEENQEITH
jgi:hypothetical protein